MFISLEIYLSRDVDQNKNPAYGVMCIVKTKEQGS